ncbi:MAG: CFI-box-CTERM domain-containing protein, partial [Oscillospiraceae bacterium]
EKIMLMLSKRIDCPGICYPVAEIYNSSKEFVGFLMPSAKGKELQRSIFIKPCFLKQFPGWKKRDTVRLCVTILEKIKYLHDRNIIMGDINPANILVVSPDEVYFVDTDSYQVEGFPCPVGTINYTAPEIQRKDFGTFLRSFGNENFAVATLLFMIMLPGKPPYSQQGGEDQATNIIKMDFSYPFGDNSNKKTPDGPWRFIWSHLTYDIKEAFYTTFRKGEEHSTEKSRLSVDEWLSLFKYYLELLESGKYGEQDEMSEELFPTRHKKHNSLTYTKCSICKNDTPESNCINGICRSCLNEVILRKECKRCHRDIEYTNYQKFIKRAKPYEICHDCYEWGRKVCMTMICVDCGEKFEITNSEREFYSEKGFESPKRCKSCRDKKKAAVRPLPPAPPESSHKHGSLCFLTTAVCEYLGKPDDCEELTTLRAFRDKWLKNQPGGEELISEYYRTAPLIVSRMKQSLNYSEYCEKLYSQYIIPCMGLIKQNRNEECRELYSLMFRYMKQEFIG